MVTNGTMSELEASYQRCREDNTALREALYIRTTMQKPSTTEALLRLKTLELEVTLENLRNTQMRCWELLEENRELRRGRAAPSSVE